MAKKKENLKGIDQIELEGKLVESRESLRNMHFKVEGSKSKNVKEIANLKKHIARILTELNRNSKK